MAGWYFKKGGKKRLFPKRYAATSTHARVNAAVNRSTAVREFMKETNARGTSGIVKMRDDETGEVQVVYKDHAPTTIGKNEPMKETEKKFRRHTDPPAVYTKWAGELRGQGATEWLCINMIDTPRTRVDMWFNANKFFFSKQDFVRGIGMVSIIYHDRERAMHKYRMNDVSYIESWELAEET